MQCALAASIYCLIEKGHVFTIIILLQVNDIAFHPSHGTLATVGSDGRYYFWDKDARTKLKVSLDTCLYFLIDKSSMILFIKNNTISLCLITSVEKH